MRNCPKCGKEVSKSVDSCPDCNVKISQVKEENSCDKFLSFWQVLVFIFIPTFIIQFLLQPYYRLAYILGSATGATITTWIMSYIGYAIIRKLPVSLNAKRALGVVIGFLLYYTISLIVASL